MTSKTLATTETNTTQYKTTYGGAVFLTLGETQIMLTAADLKVPRFSYVCDSFYTAVSLGKLGEILKVILEKFQGTTGITTETVVAQIDAVGNIPGLKQIKDADLVITEFVINPPSGDDKLDGKYSFGAGLRLTSDNKLGPITFDGISINVSLVQTA